VLLLQALMRCRVVRLDEGLVPLLAFQGRGDLRATQVAFVGKIAPARMVREDPRE
jgi:hypothetical protein